MDVAETTASIEALIASPDMIANPYPVYERLLSDEPIWTAPDGLRVFSRYEDCLAIMRDYATFGQAGGAHKKPSFVMMDPPDHTRVRGLVAKAFTPRAIGRIRDSIEVAAEELMAPIRPVEQMELVRQFARPLPTRMITEMLGIPLEDADRWEVWANAIHRSTAAISFLPEQQGRAATLRQAALDASEAETEYFQELIVRRRSEPPRQDVLGTLLIAEEQGDRLTEDELLYSLVLLLGAGHHTSVNLIANGTLALLQNPDQFELLRADRSLLPAAIDEMIRFDGIVQASRRVVRTDTELGGVELHKGDLVAPLLGAANRDPAVFPDPARFDILRQNANRHLGFGFGAHHCLGSSLARAEVGVAFNVLLDLKDLHRSNDDEPTYGEMYGLRGVEKLDIAWSAS